MGELTNRAQARNKIGEESRSNYVLRLGGQPILGGGSDPLVKTWSVAYLAQGGTSECSIETSFPLEEFTNASVDVKLGYGSLMREVFAGKLGAPEDDEFDRNFAATAWGPFQLMAEQKLKEQVDYRGWRIEEVFLDLWRRAGYRSTTIDIQVGKTFVVQGDTTAVFPYETPMVDVANSLIESSGYVFADRGGDSRIVMPRPRIGATGRAKAHYTPEHYGRGGFKAYNQTRNIYSSVVVLRREASGSFAFPPVEFPMEVTSRYKPLANRAYIISDFAGDEAEARETAAETADLLQNGSYACNLTGVSANPELDLWDTMTTEAIVSRLEGGRRQEKYDVTYRWQISEGLTFTGTRDGNTMEVSGIGTKVREVLRPKVHFVRDMRRSPYAVV